MIGDANCKTVKEEETISTKNFTCTKGEIVDILAGNIPALGGLLRITDIVPSQEVETSEVTCQATPTIYYNPDFVDTHCQNKAHLAMLILHEIYHVVLGHTIKKTISKIDNIVADAIINSLICQQYISHGFQSFFTEFYDGKKFPECILRPKSRPPRFWQRQRYKQLYSPMGASWDDLVELVSKELENEEELPTLLGSHNSTSAESSSSNIPDTILDAAATGIMNEMSPRIQRQNRQEIIKRTAEGRRIMSRLHRSQWSQDPRDKLTKKQKEALEKEVGNIRAEIDAIKDAGLSRSIFARMLQVRLDASKKRKELEEELRKVAQQSLYSKLEVKLKGMFPKIPETSVVPNYRNRRAIVSLVENIYQPFFMNPLRPRDFGAVTIYIDVSGSMSGYMQTIYKLACNCKEYLDKDIFLFSNDVRAISKEELMEGVVKTTGGTDDCWLLHALDHNKKKIMVFTDGYLRINDENKQRVRQTGTKIVVAYSPNHNKLPKEIVHSELVLDTEGNATKA